MENVVMMKKQRQQAEWKTLRQVGQFTLFLACGVLVFLVFSHYHPLLSDRLDLTGRIVVTVLLIGAALLARRSSRWSAYWPIVFAFGTACAAISVDYLLGLSGWLLPAIDIGAETPAGWAIDKLESSALSVIVVLALTLASGQSLRSLRIKRGRLGLGVGIGLAVLALVLVTAIPQAELLFGGEDLTWGQIVPWAPWVAVFVVSNAFNEELLFRGLFLSKLESFMPRVAANVLMTIPFTLMHTGVDYSSDVWLFVAIIVALSFAWGWLMQKTDSIWGSVLFHAAMDIPIVLGLFSSVG